MEKIILQIFVLVLMFFSLPVQAVTGKIGERANLETNENKTLRIIIIMSGNAKTTNIPKAKINRIRTVLPLLETLSLLILSSYLLLYIIIS